MIVFLILSKSPPKIWKSFASAKTPLQNQAILYHDLVYGGCCCIVYPWIFQHLMDKWILCSDDQHWTSVHQMDEWNRKKKFPEILSLSLVCYKSNRITKKTFLSSTIYKIMLFIPTYSTQFPQISNSCYDAGSLDTVPTSMGHLLTTFVQNNFLSEMKLCWIMELFLSFLHLIFRITFYP